MNPLDWTGPAFLAFYVVALVLAHPAGRLLNRICRSAERVGPLPELSEYEAALLAGGSARAVDTALVRLLRHEAIAVREDGRGFESRSTPPQTNDLAAELHRDIAKYQTTLEHLRGRRNVSLAPAEVRLRRLGLVLDPSSAESFCLRVTSGLPTGALIALGVAKIGVGLARGRPVLFLVILVLVSLVVLGFKVLRVPARSSLGERHLQALQQRNSALQTTASRRGAELADADLALAVALFGPNVLAGGEYAWMHQTFVQRQSGSSDGGSSSSCGSSSGCGGGGGGGGGCGGCGG